MMNEALKKFLLSLNCTVINPVKKSLTDKTVIGWHCKSTSRLRKQQHLLSIKGFLETEPDMEAYYLEEGNQYTAEFFIYIHQD